MRENPRAVERLFVALDQPSLVEAMALVDKLDGLVERYKVGLELYAAEGPQAVAQLHDRGAQVFVDLKLHDIPETVRRAARAAARAGARWITVHADGGEAMMRAAVEGAGAAKVLAVTVLTSLDAADLEAVGCGCASVEELVLRRARLARRAGCAGVIASPHEARAVRAALGTEFLIVTPGIRNAGAAPGEGDGNGPGPGPGSDQKRTATAAEAIAAGADAVVVGRPIRDAVDPRAAAAAILAELLPAGDR